MSIQAVGWALDQDLPARPKLVLVAIANHANHADGYCWLKAETIAAEAACTPRSVFRFIGGLVRNGFLRKAPKRGADGKQRANDYWILFQRAPTAWDWGAGLHDEADDIQEAEEIEAEEGAETHGSDEDDPQDVVVAPESEKHAVSYGPHDSPVIRKDAEKHAVSVGPCDSRVSHKRIAEPSKTNPEKAAPPPSVPRSYRPPPADPPQPLGATTLAGKGEFIFVFKPSKAYDAWKAVKERETGRSWNQQTTKDGRWGWYFPSLFPPEKPPPDGTELATGEDLNQFAKSG